MENMMVNVNRFIVVAATFLVAKLHIPPKKKNVSYQCVTHAFVPVFQYFDEKSKRDKLQQYSYFYYDSLKQHENPYNRKTREKEN